MPLKMPNLKAAAAELDKLVAVTEEDARRFIADIGAAHQHRRSTFDLAREKVSEVRASVGEFGQFLDALDRAGDGANGGPTLDGSSESSAAAEKATDQATEATAPPAGEAPAAAVPVAAAEAPAATPPAVPAPELPEPQKSWTGG